MEEQITTSYNRFSFDKSVVTYNLHSYNKPSIGSYLKNYIPYTSDFQFNSEESDFNSINLVPQGSAAVSRFGASKV